MANSDHSARWDHAKGAVPQAPLFSGCDTFQDQALSALQQIAIVLISGHELDATLQKALDVLVERLDTVDMGILCRYDPVDNLLMVRAASGYQLAALEYLRLAPGEARCGKAFKAGRPERSPTPEAIKATMVNMSPGNRERFNQACCCEAQSSICLPLQTDQELLGVLLLEDQKHTESFGEESLPLWIGIARLVALAIQRAEYEQDRHQAAAHEQANQFKADVISNLAHEMRTPLTSIKGYSTALLMEDVSFAPETRQEFLQFIDQECDVLQGLIHDLLESSIFDAGLLRLKPQPVRIPLLVQGIVDDLTHRAPQHRFLVDFPQEFPILDADPDRIAQVLRNLLDNAIKYSPQGGLIVVRGVIDGEEAVISVADQGIGIAPEHLNRLFEKFFRARSTPGRHVVGSGLGLPISHTIVEAHGGRIWAESQLSQGSTLYFSLPRTGLSRDIQEQEITGHV